MFYVESLCRSALPPMARASMQECFHFFNFDCIERIVNDFLYSFLRIWLVRICGYHSLTANVKALLLCNQI